MAEERKMGFKFEWPMMLSLGFWPISVLLSESLHHLFISSSIETRRAQKYSLYLINTMRFLSSLASNVRNIRQRWTLPSSIHRYSSSLIPKSNPNPLFIDFLRDNGIHKSQAITIANRFPNFKSLEQPQCVIQLLKNHDFSETQIQNWIRARPEVMFCNAEKILKPKIRFFEQLGFSSSALGDFISKNPSVIAASLEKKLIPCAEILKTIVAAKDLALVITRCSWLLKRDPNSFLLPNISYLRSLGIVDTQLLSLLKRRPGILILPEQKLKANVSFALDLGFSLNSGMMVLAILSLSCLTKQTIDRKFQVFVANGFSDDEARAMIRKSPGLIRCGEDKLKMGMKLYMETMGIKREALVKRPAVLMLSIEKRVIPRLQVLQILKEKGLLKEDKKKKKKKISFFEIIGISENEFLERYVLSFGNEIAEELMVAFKDSNVHHIKFEDVSTVEFEKVI